jgi:hypothetical protein
MPDDGSIHLRHNTFRNVFGLLCVRIARSRVGQVVADFLLIIPTEACRTRHDDRCASDASEIDGTLDESIAVLRVLVEAVLGAPYIRCCGCRLWDT